MRLSACAIAASMLVFSGCNGQKSSSQILTSTTDSNGTLHPAQLQLSRPAQVTCLSAVGNNNSGAKCNVNGSSVEPSESVTTADKVYLLCEGTAPLKCSAKVAR
jgi:hypothetical protein